MIQLDVLHLPEDAARWDLVAQFLRLRAKVFVEKMHWDLHVSEGMEHEQYDLVSLPVYVIAHEDGVVVGGARLLRCDASYGKGRGQVTYMIRDAYLGMIDLPSQICTDPPPTDAESWELTRLISIDNGRSTVHAILETANTFIKSRGGKQCLFLGPPAFLRLATNFGYKPRPLGPVVSNQDGSFLAFACDTR